MKKSIAAAFEAYKAVKRAERAYRRISVIADRPLPKKPYGDSKYEKYKYKQIQAGIVVRNAESKLDSLTQHLPAEDTLTLSQLVYSYGGDPEVV